MFDDVFEWRVSAEHLSPGEFSLKVALVIANPACFYSAPTSYYSYSRSNRIKYVAVFLFSSHCIKYSKKRKDLVWNGILSEKDLITCFFF